MDNLGGINGHWIACEYLEEARCVHQNRTLHQLKPQWQVFIYPRETYEESNMNRHWLKLFLILLLLTGFNFQLVQAAISPLHTYIPIGSGYSTATLQRFAQAAVQHD